MGCGCITPGSTIHMQNEQYVHSIKVTRLAKGSKSKIGERFFGEEQNFQKPFSKKEFYAQKKPLNFDSKYSIRKNTYASTNSLKKKPIISIEDFKSSSTKKKKSVKFRDEARLSIKLQTIDKTEFDEKSPMNVFQKQNTSPKKLMKKPKYLINRVKTQKQQVLPLIEGSFHSGSDQNSLKGSELNLQQVKNLSVTKGKFPKINRAQTQENDAYLRSLKQIVLFGQKKNQQMLSKKRLNLVRSKQKNQILTLQLNPTMDRFDFKKKKSKVF